MDEGGRDWSEEKDEAEKASMGGPGWHECNGVMGRQEGRSCKGTGAAQRRVDGERAQREFTGVMQQRVGDDGRQALQQVLVQ